MAKLVCKNCSMAGVCRDSRVSWVFFLVGIVATIAMRVIEPLNLVDPIYGKISWYVGVTGFFVFFVYKYRIQVARKKVIEEKHLVEKLAYSKNLTASENRLVAELVCSQASWKERANFFVIFALSALALIVALIADLT
ncbi:MAG: hypothetical protein ABH834_04055 [Candidatus Altiarchaeota archaeon]